MVVLYFHLVLLTYKFNGVFKNGQKSVFIWTLVVKLGAVSLPPLWGRRLCLRNVILQHIEQFQQPHSDFFFSSVLHFCLSANQYLKYGAKHAATVATAFYSCTNPGRHRNPKSGRILRGGEARRGAGHRTRWWVFQNPGRSRRKAIKCKNSKL